MSIMPSVQFTADVVRYININVPASGQSFYSVCFPVLDIWDVNDDDKTLQIYPNVLYRATFPAVSEVWIHFFSNAYSRLPMVFVGDINTASGLGSIYDTNRVDRFQSILNGVVQNHNASEYLINDYDGVADNVVLHFKSGSSDGLVEIKVRDYDATYYTAEELTEYFGSPDCITTVTRTGNVNNGLPLDTVFFTITDADEYNVCPILAKVVVSSYEVDINGDLVQGATVPVTATFDIQRILNANVTVSTNVNLQRVIVASVEQIFDTHAIILRSINFGCDVLRQIPHRLTFDAATQSVELELAAQQLTERLTFNTVSPVEIMQAVRGQYLDYRFDMRIEDLTRRGILTSCQCCSDVDELLYTPLSYEVDSDYVSYEVDIHSKTIKEGAVESVDSDTTIIKKASALRHMQFISNALGKSLVAQFDGFVSDLEIEQECVTYSDIIDELFGWTSRLPHLLINCYIRDDTIFVIQRGHETNVVDISALKRTVPIVRQELIRTTWGSGEPDSQYTLNIRHLGMGMYPPPPYLSEDGKTYYSYRRVNPHGYLLTETNTFNDDNTITTTVYHYTSLTPYELTGETTTIRDEHGKQVERRYTKHTYLTPSQRHTIVVGEDGEDLGGVVGSHVAGFYDEHVTLIEPYTSTDTAVISGNPLIDTSFPVVGNSKLIELSKAVRWLNRKTKETVSLDIFDYPHVFDFNDQILFDGNTYFLDSNTVVKTPRIINKQSLTIVRWF